MDFNGEVVLTNPKSRVNVLHSLNSPVLEDYKPVDPDRSLTDILIPRIVNDFLEGEYPKASTELYQALLDKKGNVRSGFVITEVLVDEIFLQRLAEVLSEVVDEPAFNLIRVINVLWKLGNSDYPQLITPYLFNAVMLHMRSAPEVRVAAVLALHDFAKTNQACTYILLEHGICDALCAHLDDIKGYKRRDNPHVVPAQLETLQFVNDLVSMMKPEDYPALNPLIPHYLPFITDRRLDLRLIASKCIIDVMDVPEVFGCLMENDFVDYLLRAQEMNPARQAANLYTMFKKVIERVGLSDDAWETLFRKLYIMMDHDKAEWIEDSDVYPYVCAVIRLVMPTHHAQIYGCQIIRQLVRWAEYDAKGTGIMRIEMAVCVAMFMTYADLEQVDEVIANGGLAAVMTVLPDSDEYKHELLQCLERLLRDGRVDEEAIEYVSDMDTDDMTPECHELFQLLLQRV